jgi:hypothetical protein
MAYDVISEHEPRNQDDKTPIYSPSPEERQAIKLVEGLFQKAKLSRSRYDNRWLDYYHFFRGKQWKETRPSYRHSEVINFIFQSIQSTVPIITDSRPRFNFIPQEPTDADFATLMNDIADSDWTKHNWLNELTELIYDGHFYGTGLSSLCYDDEADHGEGRIKYESEDPFWCFPAPEARDTNKECPYFVHARPRPLDWVKKRWPEHKEHVKADLIDLMKGAKTDLKKISFRSPVDDKLYLEQDGNPSDSLDKDKALVITVFIKEDEAFEEFEKEVDGQKVYEQRKKYPNGRRLIVCSGVLLEDGPNPYEDGDIPFARWQNYVLPREFWGISEVEQLESPQRIFNKLISFALDVLTLMGNPVWIVSNDSDVDTENLFNRPGLIIEKNPGSEVRREEGTQLQPYVLQLIDRMQQWFNDIAGTQDVTRGATPGSVTAASAISSLQEAAQTRVRQKSRNLDCYLQTVGQQYASRVMQYYTAPRVFRLTNNEGATRYFKAMFEGGTATVQQWNAEGQGWSEPVKLQAQGKLDVKVTTGSALPFAKAEKEQKLLQLFDRGIIDPQEVLQGTDYPNWETVLQRVQERQAAAAQAQAAAQQQG